MTREMRRNKTKWIKLWKKRGYRYFRGYLWRTFRWTMTICLPELEENP